MFSKNKNTFISQRVILILAILLSFFIMLFVLNNEKSVDATISNSKHNQTNISTTESTTYTTENITTHSEENITIVPTTPTTGLTTSEIPEQTTNSTQKHNYKNAVFYCIETREQFIKYNMQERIAPASLTKLLTACVAVNYLDFKDEIVVGSELELLPPHSSLSLIQKGHVLKLEDILVGLLLPSGNDAAYTIAVNVARSLNQDRRLSDKEAIEFFCDLMNDFSVKIGMKNSNFTTPDGFDDKNQYTTIADLMVLSEYFLNNERLSNLVTENKKYVVFESGENITWRSTNKLICPDSKHYNEYAVGLKTGTTAKAGNCLIAAYKKNNRTYIGIVCGCNSQDSRYEIMNDFFYEFACK